MRLYDDILLIRWDDETGVFHDVYGCRIDNIFELVSPNDLYLFRRDHGCCIFPHRNIRRIGCEIFIEE